MIRYQDLFSRNLGVFTPNQQKRLKNSRVLIVGCGGIGGTVAVILARSGVGCFELVDFDEYEPSNMNRQIACFSSTLGRNKAEAVREQILEINPDARVVAHPKLLTLEDIFEKIKTCDLVFPAADDFAFSLMVFKDAQKLNKPALFVVPSGTWANVSLIGPKSPPVEDIQGLPRLSTYEEFCELFEDRKYKLGSHFYVTSGGWQKEWFRGFMEQDLPLAQICPVVWMSSCLGAHETVKLLARRGRPVISPRYWAVKENGIRIQRAGGINTQSALAMGRRFFYRLFQTPAGPWMEKAQDIWWKRYLEKME